MGGLGGGAALESLTTARVGDKGEAILLFEQ